MTSTTHQITSIAGVPVTDEFSQVISDIADSGDTGSQWDKQASQDLLAFTNEAFVPDSVISTIVAEIASNASLNPVTTFSSSRAEFFDALIEITRKMLRDENVDRVASERAIQLVETYADVCEIVVSSDSDVSFGEALSEKLRMLKVSSHAMDLLDEIRPVDRAERIKKNQTQLTLANLSVGFADRLKAELESLKDTLGEFGIETGLSSSFADARALVDVNCTRARTIVNAFEPDGGRTLSFAEGHC